MPRVIPFAALRPCPERASDVAAPPYDVLSSDEARVLVNNNPYSFLHVDKAEIDCEPGISLYDEKVYAKARENLNGLIEDGVLIKDPQPCLYIYRLTAKGKTQTGMACCVDVNDYERGLIKKHELTRPDKEQDRVNHIKACEAHTGPIFMSYKSESGLCGLLEEWTDSHTPTYDFTADDGVRHILWVIDEPSAIKKLTAAFEEVSCFYIADGHHRSAAAFRVSNEARDDQSTVKTARDIFLAVLFPHDELTILDYNRLVRDLNGYTPDTLLTALRDAYTVEESVQPVKPQDTHEYGLYLDSKWYKLTYKKALPNDVVDGLAVSVLQTSVLAPLLGIQDPQTDKRIDFVGGARGVEGLTKRVDSGEMAAAFTLCPTKMQELMAVSDAGRIMPPKSTWFEPKLRSGLLIHPFNHPGEMI